MPIVARVSDWRRHVRDLQLNQGARRNAPVDAMETDEIRAVKFLAADLFGKFPGGAPRGVVQFDQDVRTMRRIGPFQVGYFLDPPHPLIPGNHRKRVILFHGSSHRELVEQVRVWKSRGGDT